MTPEPYCGAPPVPGTLAWNTDPNCKGSEAQVAEQIHAGSVPGWARQTQ